MSTKEQIEQLRQAATKDTATEAVLRAFSERQRARSTVMIQSLSIKMKRRGHLFPRHKYEAIVRLLATLGFGTLIQDAKGRVRGLKDIKMTLQSIGKAALGNENEYRQLKIRNRYKDLPPTQASTPARITAEPTIMLAIAIKGRLIPVQIPQGMTREEIGDLITDLNTKNNLNQEDKKQ